MKTPGYWSDLNPLSLLLSPLGLLYNLGTRLNMSLHKPQKAAVPVVCIGNLTAGGTGKTPTAPGSPTTRSSSTPPLPAP